MRTFSVIIALALAFAPAAMAQNQADIVELASKGPLGIANLFVNNSEIARYEKFEITFDLSGDWDNPYDPGQISVDAVFTAPSGTALTVPGFFYQEYRFTQQGRRSVYETIGAPVWKVRFSPIELGEYSCRITVNNKNTVITSEKVSFTSTPNTNSHGYLGISETNPLYFDFRDGEPFFAMAMDKAMGSIPEFTHLYTSFARAGGNYNRLFLTHSLFNIEEQRVGREPRPDKGLGKMNLENAWSLDRVIELGEQNSIYHQLCITNQTNFRVDNGGWDRNVYNKALGGILDTPGEYFTSDEAMNYVERRLRYIIARWGYSTAVHSWDFWNECSAANGYTPELAQKWHQRMARYTSSIDWADHVIHTNYGNLDGEPIVDGLPEMELVSTNIYCIKDIAYVAEEWTKRLIAKYNKPYLLTEYGIGHNVGPLGGYGTFDPDRIMIHNGIWSPMVSGSAGTGMSWDWNWLDNENFYRYIEAAAMFTEGIPFSKRTWKPLTIAGFRFADTGATSYYADVLADGWPGNYRFPPEAEHQKLFTIRPDGRVAEHDYLPAVLYGKSPENTGMRKSEVTFQVQYPVNGEFVVYVAELRDTTTQPKLTVSMDTRVLIENDLGPLDEPNFNPIKYNRAFSFPVPAGRHVIKIENTGGGSMVTAYELKRYVPKDGPNLEVRGMQTDDVILVWLKNPKFTWLHKNMLIAPEEQPEGTLELTGIADGAWVAEWFDTVEAKLFNREIVRAENGRLILSTPKVTKSAAVRLLKTAE